MPPQDNLILNKALHEEQGSLRAEAEVALAHSPLKGGIPPPPEKLLHELEVHQVELEMQNETLRQTMIALEESRDRYVDFYDLAPTGFITLSRDALITEINLTGAALLGKERIKLAGHRFITFVSPVERDFWHRFFLSVINSTDKLSCELTLLRGDGHCFYAQLDCLHLLKDGKTPEVRIVLTDITARNQLEAALLDSEKHRHFLEQQKIVQASLDGFWVVNANNGSILDVNDIYCDMVGYSREEILSMTIQDLEAVETPEETETRIKKVMEFGYDRFETRHRHKQGHLINLEVSISHTETNGGLNFVFFRDITERKHAEQFKQSILNSVADEIAVLDRNGVVLAVNLPWKRFAMENCIKCDLPMSGKECGNPLLRIDIGVNCLAACQSSSSLGTDTAQAFIRGIYAVLDGHLKDYAFEYPCYSSPQKRWFRMTVTPFGETENNGVVIAHTDITDRKHAEESIRQSLNQLKVFIEQAPISIAMFDRNMDYLAVSGRWFKEFNRGYPNLVGRNHYEVNPDISAKWKAIHRQALGGVKTERNDDMWVQRDGSKHWLSWAVYPWVDENKNIGGIIISTENITDTKMLEMERIAHRNEMEQLQRQHVAAQTASAIAHEINQPLHAIASYCQAGLMMMKSRKPDYDEICDALEKSEQQALRAGQSIRDLISFLNKKEFPREPFDFNQEIRNIMGTVKSEHNLVFHSILNLEEGLPFVRANRIHVQKVLLNLIHNGLDAMQAAGVPLPAITLNVRTTKDNSFAQVTIQDNGPGIKKEDINRLFEPFYTTKSKGIGMGLAISRSLIEENGGQLWVDSKEDQGAAFHLTLPFAI